MIRVMKVSRKFAALAVTGLVLLVSALPSPSLGAEKGRAYGGLLFSFSRISGKSFDGHSGTEVSGVFAAVPKLDAGPSYGALIGIRGEFFGAEISYIYSRSKGSLFDPTPEYLASRAATAANHAVNIDFKFHFWPDKTIGAYALAGLSIDIMNVRKGFFGQEATGLKPGSPNEYNYVWKEYGDVSFFGLGADLGAGLEINLSSRFILNAGILVRPTFFSSLDLKPYDPDYDVSTHDFNVSGMTGLYLALTAGIQYVFSKY